MLVDDSAVNRLVGAGLVEVLGYAVDCVDDGRQALHALAGTRYDAVLMDCHMPVLDGLTATRLLRAGAGDAARIPVIAMTASAMTDDRSACLDAGMDDYLSKPLTLAVLAETLDRWVSAGR